jgi:hypothetical protein
MNSYLKEFWQSFLVCFNSLASYEFSFLNPLFWIALLLLLLVLIRRWDIRKAFSFCVVLAVILLATTRIVSYYLSMFHEADQFVDATVIKLASVFVSLMTLIVYIFLIK